MIFIILSPLALGTVNNIIQSAFCGERLCEGFQCVIMLEVHLKDDEQAGTLCTRSARKTKSEKSNLLVPLSRPYDLVKFVDDAHTAMPDT